MKSQALILFLKNPVPGKVKTRLAATVGDQKALDIYLKLLEINKKSVSKIDQTVFWFINESPGSFLKGSFFQNEDKVRLQKGKELGEKMTQAFDKVFAEGYHSVCIMGTDCPDLSPDIIKESFEKLKKSDFVIGPAEDGGYYLLGMNAFYPDIFKDIEWSTDSVLLKTKERISTLQKSYALLPLLNDVDNESDARNAGLL